MSIIQVECLAAGALQLLLRLKRHLKILYDLNDARCQVWLSELAVSCAWDYVNEPLAASRDTYLILVVHQAYSPNDPLKPGESLSKQSLPFNVNEINIEHPKNYEDFVQRYQVTWVQ